jgi:hypothetical protein
MEISESMQLKMGMRRQDRSELSRPHDFMILCPAVAENSGVIEALYALYYLPQNYKLLITTVGVKSKALFERIRDIMGTDSLKNRVIVRGEMGKQDGSLSPFLDANVVVYGSSDPMYSKDSPQSIVVFDIASKLMSLNGTHNFAVASSTPEALASAILRVARNQH